MEVVKRYDKDGNEIPKDYKAEKFQELSDFLTRIVQNILTRQLKNT